MVWARVKEVLGWFFKKEGGTTQIGGTGNQSGTTSGTHSPIISGQGNTVNYIPPAQPASEENPLSELEASMPDVLEDLRKQLSEHPNLRDILWLRTRGI